MNECPIVMSTTYNGVVSIVIKRGYAEYDISSKKNKSKDNITFNMNDYIIQLSKITTLKIKRRRLHRALINSMCIEYKRVVYGMKANNKRYRRILQYHTFTHSNILNQFMKIIEHMILNNKLEFIKKHISIELLNDSTNSGLSAYSINIDNRLWAFMQQSYYNTHTEHTTIIDYLREKHNEDVKRLDVRLYIEPEENNKLLIESFKLHYPEEFDKAINNLTESHKIKPLLNGKLFDVLSSLFMETDANKDAKTKEIDELYEKTIMLWERENDEI